MYPQERQDQIMALLRQYQYTTVAYLVDTLHYSPATIHRDLNELQAQGLLRRSYGGVELAESGTARVQFRVHQQHRAKQHIAARAAELVETGDIIFIDGSTTAQFMGPLIVSVERLTVITNNLSLALYLSEHGVHVVCLGGAIKESPSMVGGIEAAEQLRRYSPGKMFFSVGAVDDRGRVCGGSVYRELIQAGLEVSHEAYLLVDSEKHRRNGLYTLCDFGSLTGVISDFDFSPLQDAYPSTRFYRVES